VDTVGFIHDLPDELRKAFLATLEGIGEADLLIHVADGSSERMDENLASVDKILAELGFAGKPAVLALNKMDLGSAGAQVPGSFRISAATGEGLDALLRAVEGEPCLNRSERTGLTRPA
jgi:GTP-binding protein HflX